MTPTGLLPTDKSQISSWKFSPSNGHLVDTSKPVPNPSIFAWFVFINASKNQGTENAAVGELPN